MTSGNHSRGEQRNDNLTGMLCIRYTVASNSTQTVIPSTGFHNSISWINTQAKERWSGGHMYFAPSSQKRNSSSLKETRKAKRAVLFLFILLKELTEHHLKNQRLCVNGYPSRSSFASKRLDNKNASELSSNPRFLTPPSPDLPIL